MAKRSAVALLALGAWLAPAAQAQAAAPEPEPKPAWQLSLLPLPTNFEPGSQGTSFLVGPMYRLVATNVGGAPTSGTVTLKVTLPPGIAPAALPNKPIGDTLPFEPGPTNPVCEAAGQVVTCTVSEPTPVSRWVGARIPVKAAAEPTLKPGDVLTAIASVKGGGAQPISTEYATEIGAKAPPFGFLPGPAGLTTLFTDADATPAGQAGSHPYQATVDVGFPVAQPLKGQPLTAAGHLRSLLTDLPPGFLGDPTAVARCTEAQFITSSTTDPGCPDGSQVGVITAMTVESLPNFLPVPLYNMVPPPGVPAELGFNALNQNIFIHVDAELRSDSDYGVSVGTDDILARTLNPIMSVQAQVWGDPTAEVHDEIRGVCRGDRSEFCPVDRRDEAFLTMPSACSGPLETTVRARSWEEPDLTRERTAQSTDVFGKPVGISGCSALDFKPAIALEPTTRTTDSPTGLAFDLRQPQDQWLGHNSTAILRDATVTLPEGMAVNPAQAAGLAACSSSQVGLSTAIGATPIHFSKQPDDCPDAAKVGSVEIDTPLLEEPVPGSLYLAKPFDNPFGTLTAAYIAVDDPKTGIVAKLAGEVTLDPLSGQVTTRFEENPQLPIEDVKVRIFPGPRAALATPPLCGTHTATADLTPWSAPEGQDAHPSASFETTAAPGGGACPASAGAMPSSPSFAAGVSSPQAGAYSPFVLKLSREDGSQRLAGLEATLPPGLVARFAGVGVCLEAGIARAEARRNPNEGALEQADPSCPASSKVGIANAGAGVGPNPFYTQGTVYLAGPYKGAPISMVIVTPAVAGPFDLGTVVVRSALYVDPNTAQGHAVSDPLPQILQGIPLDLRSAEVRLDRGRFVRNPTSCNAMSITASALSALGQVTPLAQRFQVVDCSSLPFEPKLSLSLKGGTGRGAHPRLRAVGTAKEGEANLARASVALPHSEFLDQAHIRTVCTRVQFAAGQCPAGAVYGYVRAKSPLLDEELQGPVYLRSSSHKLPDMVAVLKGPPSRPIEIDVVGRIDSVNGGIRTTIESIPDAPVSKFVLTMQGARKGLLINSRNLCQATNRATVKLDGQNGKTHDFRPKLKASCGAQHQSRRKRAR